MILLIAAEEPQGISISRVPPIQFNELCLLLGLDVIVNENLISAKFKISEITIKLYKRKD